MHDGRSRGLDVFQNIYVYWVRIEVRERRANIESKLNLLDTARGRVDLIA